MSNYHMALFIAAVITGLVSCKTPRAILWILMLAASFTASVSFAFFVRSNDLGFPHTGVTMLCDIVVFLSIREFGKERWETRLLAPLVSFSAAVSLIYTTLTIFPIYGTPPQLLYAITLEVINYIALLIIGGVGLLNLIKADNEFFIPRSALRYFLSCRRFLQVEDRTRVLTK